MPNVERNLELSKYRYALAEETLQNAEMSFVKRKLIQPIVLDENCTIGYSYILGNYSS